MIIDRPEGNKLTGFYLGRVVEHLPNGKYKVFIPGVYADEYKAFSDYLPPAVLANDVFNGGINGDGQISYVCNGTAVYCVFANGDQNRPVIVAVQTGGDDFTKIQNLASFGIIADSGCKYDYGLTDPVSISKRGKTMIKQSAAGHVQAIAQRNMMNAYDSPNATYSHSMHMLGIMYKQGRVQNKNYFVFSNNPGDIFNSDIKYKLIVNRKTDGDDQWYIDHQNDSNEENYECVGISCVIDPESDEQYLVGKKIDSADTGIQCETSWNRQIYSSWGGQSHSDPCNVIGGTISNVYINCDGKRKFVEFAAKYGAGLYICNGLQYGFVPQYWDKNFQGSYPNMDPIEKVSPAVIADSKSFSINIYLLDPYRITVGHTISENGHSVLSVHNQKTEYEKIKECDGSGTVCRYEFLQDGEYGDVQRAIDSYYLKDKTESIRGLSSYDVRRWYGYISATSAMETSETSSIQSLSSDIYRHENLTAEWTNADAVNRDSYEEGARDDVGVLSDATLYYSESYSSPDNARTRILSSWHGESAGYTDDFISSFVETKPGNACELLKYASVKGGDPQVQIDRETSTADAVIGNKIDDQREQTEIIERHDAKNGKIEVKITDLDTGTFSRFYLDKAGNVYMESSQSIVLKSKVVSIQSENQFDLKANSMKVTTDTDATIVSPAIALDSSAGHTVIKSTTGVKTF